MLPLLNIAKISIPISFHLLPKVLKTPTKTLNSISKMYSSWACSACTFVNPPTQKSLCQICLSTQPQPQSLLLSSSPSLPFKPSWSCTACTFMNSNRSSVCEICSTIPSASLLSLIELDEDDLNQVNFGSSVGNVLLRVCNSTDKENGENTIFSGSGNCNFENGGSVVKKGFMGGLRPCSNKRKNRDEQENVAMDGDVEGFINVADEDAVAQKTLAAGETSTGSVSKIWKILSYNIWFREDLEMHSRMRALGNLIQLHSPDVICFQEVTPDFCDIFKKSSWWKGYCCSISDEKEFPGAYFCMQLSKLPVKSYSCKPFHNSIMGRELCIAEVELQPNMPFVVATSHLESPCPSPPTWNQMFSKQRVEQANEAINFLNKNPNVIFCGDMNWDDKLDGNFPKPDGWLDAWTELRPGEVGYTYDTKSNKMLSGNRALQKRLDRFLCKLKDFKISKIEMIGMDEIPGLSYVKEKRVKGQVKELELPVLPSDHYGLLLTICSLDSE